MAADRSKAHASDPDTAVRASKRQWQVVRWLLALLGLGLVGTGCAAIFNTDNGAGAAALVAAGSLLVLLGALGDRLESLRFGDMEVRLRREADEAAARGDLEAARVLERAADIVGGRARRAARLYAALRSGMPAGPERTARMEMIIAEARNDARASDIDEEDVHSLLWTRSEGARVWALGVLQERPELATPRAVLDAVQHPDEMFDQYHALRLAYQFVKLSNIRTWALQRVANAARSQLESGAFGKDYDCNILAPEILEYIARRLSINSP